MKITIQFCLQTSENMTKIVVFNKLFAGLKREPLRNRASCVLTKETNSGIIEVTFVRNVTFVSFCVSFSSVFSLQVFRKNSHFSSKQHKSNEYPADIRKNQSLYNGR